jgi:hypothetical protein
MEKMEIDWGPEKDIAAAEDLEKRELCWCARAISCGG